MELQLYRIIVFDECTSLDHCSLYIDMHIGRLTEKLNNIYVISIQWNN